MVEPPNLYESLRNAYDIATEVTSTPQDADIKLFQEGEKVDLSETEITGHDVAESFTSPEEINYREFSLGEVRYWCDGQVLGSPDRLRLAAGEDFFAYNSGELTGEDVEKALDRMIEQRETEIEDLAGVEDRL